MPIIPKIIEFLLLLIGLYHPGKFENDVGSQPWDILFTSPVTDQKRDKGTKKQNQKDLYLHANLTTSNIVAFLRQKAVTNQNAGGPER